MHCQQCYQHQTHDHRQPHPHNGITARCRRRRNHRNVVHSIFFLNGTPHSHYTLHSLRSHEFHRLLSFNLFNSCSNCSRFQLQRPTKLNGNAPPSIYSVHRPVGHWHCSASAILLYAHKLEFEISINFTDTMCAIHLSVWGAIECYFVFLCDSMRLPTANIM